MSDLSERTQRLRQGGAQKYHEKNAQIGKKFARERIAALCDSGSFVEDGLFANCLAEGLAADGVITGLATVNGRRVALMANDSTIKAGSWGKRTVEKILRIQETAEKLKIPVFYLVDSAGARITDQVEMFPGRRGAGHIFCKESQLSGQIPQICLLFGPSAAGGAYIPSFCDIVIMVKGNASMYLGSPRMAEAVIGEKVSLEEMGGAQMHCTVSGCGDVLVENEDQAIELAKRYLAYFPQNCSEAVPVVAKKEPAQGSAIGGIVPAQGNRAYDMKKLIHAIVDEGSFFEMKELFAKELVTGFARLDGRVVGILGNQPMVKAGVLFVDSADKAARFIQVCDAFGIPLLFLADVPGFMIGSKVEREGIIRAGAKMVYCVSRASVPKISVVVRKAYGAGLYAMCGPAYETDCVLALPTAEIAVMGAEPAINAVYFNQMAKLNDAEKKTFIAEKKAEYEKDIDLFHLAAEQVVDHVLEYTELRSELIKRFHFYSNKSRDRLRTGILPM